MKRTTVTIIGVLALVALFTATPFAAEKKEVKGFCDIELLMTPGQLEKVCYPFLTVVKERESYLCGKISKFEGLDYSKGTRKISRELFHPPIKSTKVNLINSKVWEIIVTFESKDYDDIKNLIALDYGRPDNSVNKGEMSLYDRLDVWNNRGRIEKIDNEKREEGGCIWLWMKPESNVGEIHVRFIEKCNQ